MQLPGGDNAGPGSDIFRLELMSEKKETPLEKMKVNGTIFELNFIFSQIFISDWTRTISFTLCTKFHLLDLVFFQSI